MQGDGSCAPFASKWFTRTVPLRHVKKEAKYEHAAEVETGEKSKDRALFSWVESILEPV